MRVLVRLQMSHPKSSCNKGLGETLGSQKLFTGNSFQDVYSLLLKRSCFVCALHREPKACGCSGRAAALLSPNSPAMGKATGRNVALQVEPVPD